MDTGIRLTALDPQTGKPRGFVTIAVAEIAATQQIDAIPGSVIEPKEIEVNGKMQMTDPVVTPEQPAYCVVTLKCGLQFMCADRESSIYDLTRPAILFPSCDAEAHDN